eukprot:6591-Heterococcus_DN1.PRE.2
MLRCTSGYTSLNKSTLLVVALLQYHNQCDAALQRHADAATKMLSSPAQGELCFCCHLGVSAAHSVWCLTRRPLHLSSTNEVHVQVKDLLAALLAIIDHQSAQHHNMKQARGYSTVSAVGVS